MTVSDDFNRADNATSLGVTSVGGLTWTAITGTWGISSNQAYRPVSSGAVDAAYVDPGIADGTATVTLAVIAGAPGLILRAQDINNYIGVFYQSSAVNLIKVVGGSTTVITAPSATVAAGDMIGAVLSGSSITLQHNGVPVGTTQIVTNFQTNTKHGLLDHSGVGTTQRWDDWSFVTGTASAWWRPAITVRSRALARASVI